MSTSSGLPAPGTDPWLAFALDPREPDNARLRAADRDRDIITGWLGAAYSEGRLDHGEYDERSSAAVAAKTLGELPPLVVDLLPTSATPVRRITGGDLVAATPADLERRAQQAWRAHVRGAFLGFLGPSLICWIIYASSFGGFPWPAIVSVVTGLNVLRVFVNRQEFIDEEVTRLAKKQRRQLKPPEQPMGDV